MLEASFSNANQQRGDLPNDQRLPCNTEPPEDVTSSKACQKHSVSLSLPNAPSGKAKAVLTFMESRVQLHRRFEIDMENS